MSDRDPKTGQFLMGHNGYGGRPAGSRNKLGEKFLEDFYADWLDGGPEAIKAMRMADPSGYVKVAASILPKELNVKVDPIDELTDAELAQRIAQFAALVGIEIRAVAPSGGTSEADGAGETLN